MSTSNRMIVLEAAIGAALVAAGVWVGSPSDLWMGTHGFHPAWITILVLAARYGTRGLLVALAITVAVLAGVATALGEPLTGLADRTANPSDLLALGAAILVAWIAMLHESRLTRLTHKLEDAEGWRKDAIGVIDALHDNVALLRSRHDRIDRSLMVWRDVASRMESGDPMQAGKAALELSSLQSGACGGFLQWWDGISLRALTWSTREPASDQIPRDISVDRTARAAADLRSAVIISRVEGATADDCDVAVPILDPQGRGVLGVIGLRGVLPDHLTEADLQTLTMIADWLAPTIERSMHVRRPRAMEIVRP